MGGYVLVGGNECVYVSCNSRVRHACAHVYLRADKKAGVHGECAWTWAL